MNWAVVESLRFRLIPFFSYARLEFENVDMIPKKGLNRELGSRGTSLLLIFFSPEIWIHVRVKKAQQHSIFRSSSSCGYLFSISDSFPGPAQSGPLLRVFYFLHFQNHLCGGRSIGYCLAIERAVQC